MADDTDMAIAVDRGLSSIPHTPIKNAGQSNKD